MPPHSRLGSPEHTELEHHELCCASISAKETVRALPGISVAKAVPLWVAHSALHMSLQSHDSKTWR